MENVFNETTSNDTTMALGGLAVQKPVGMNSFTMFKKAPTNRVFDTESLVCISNENN